MADIEGNVAALDRSIARALKSLGLSPSGDFSKLLQPQWIQDQGGVVYSARLDVYQRLPRDPAGALLVKLSRTWYSLTLDPVWTTPQAIIAVSFEQPSSHTMAMQLVPGQTIPVPNGFNQFYVWAGDYLGGGFAATLGILGYVRFLLGASAIDRPNFLGVKPHPLARILGAVNAAAGLNQAGWVPTNVPRVRALLRGVMAGNAYSAVRFVASLTHFTYSRNQIGQDVAPGETPDLFGGIQEAVPIGQVTASSFGVSTPPTVRVRSEPGLANALTLFGPVNDPTGAVSGIRTIIEAIEASEIERADFEDLVLFDFTTPANTALDTGIVPVYGMRQLHFQWSWSAGLAASLASAFIEVDDGGISHTVSAGGFAVGSAGNAEATMSTGPGCSYAASVAAGVSNMTIPNRIRLTTAAAGAGITTRLRIFGVPK